MIRLCGCALAAVCGIAWFALDDAPAPLWLAGRDALAAFLLIGAASALLAGADRAHAATARVTRGRGLHAGYPRRTRG